MSNCIVIVQFPLAKRTEEQAIKGGTGTAPTYRDLAGQGLIRKDYLNGEPTSLCKLSVFSILFQQDTKGEPRSLRFEALSGDVKEKWWAVLESNR